jgi:hypothetical protein
MPLITIDELSLELSMPRESLMELIDQHVITPYGGRVRLGEPRFSTQALPDLKTKLRNHLQVPNQHE